jgi:polyisoprenyl-phosphate glycosyltransferase
MEIHTQVSIVIPFFNELDTIPSLLKKIEEYYNERRFDFDIVFVDDGSMDNSGELIKNCNSISFPAKLISLSKNFGSHAAVRAGILHSNGQYVTYLPSDLQISFDTVLKLYNKAIEGNDIVYGVRKINEIGFFEKIFSNFMLQ